MVKANTPSIDTRPPMLRRMEAEGSEMGAISVDGRPFQYTLIKAGLAAPLPYGIGFLGDHLFISEETPVEFRPFLLTHEARHEKMLTDLPPVRRCETAMKMEVIDVFRHIPQEAPEYLAQRQKFYDALLTYYKDPKNSGARGEDFVEGLRIAKVYLDGKVIQFPVKTTTYASEFGIYEDE